ncbi:Putative ribonuclease H protein At1g65750, partial [Linum perenne]
SAAGLWDSVVRSVEQKVQWWKAKFLSFGGRVTLLKSVLSGLPVYFMSLFKAPAKVIKRIERIQNNFLWSGSNEGGKIHWVDWNMVKTDKKFGGLGVHDLATLNSALLSKWMWRYAVERNAWWRSLIEIKCKGGSDWIPAWNLGPAGWSIWRWVLSVNHLFWSYGFIDPGVGGFMCVLVRLLGGGGSETC